MTYFFLSFILLIYFLTNTNTLYGGDAGDLLSAILSHSFAHPPGYPLYTLLGEIFNQMPLPLTPAGKVSLISALATVSALYLLHRIITEILPNGKNEVLLQILTLTIIGFNYIIWLYAVVPEVFPLNTTIVFLIFYQSIRFYKTKKNSYLYWLVLLIGIGISHHHTFILALPACFYLLWQQIKKIESVNIIKVLIFFTIGLLPLLKLVVASFNPTAYIWEDTHSLSGFFALLTRQNYGSFLATPIVLKIPQDRLKQIIGLVNFLIKDFSYIGIFFVALGFGYYLKKTDKNFRRLFLATYINIIFFGPIFLMYANFPFLNDYYLATLERFYHIIYFFLGLPLFFGLLFLRDYIFAPVIKKLINTDKIYSITVNLILIILFYIPIYFLKVNYPLITALKNDRTAENVGWDVVNFVRPKSLIFANSDIVDFNSLYIANLNNNFSNDVAMINSSRLKKSFTIRYLKNKLRDIRIPQSNNSDQHWLINFITKNKENYHFYFEQPFFIEDKSNYRFIPVGLVYALSTSNEKKRMYEKDLEKFLTHSQISNLIANLYHPKTNHLFTRETYRLYSTALINIANYYIWDKQFDNAKKLLPLAKKLALEDENLLANVYLSNSRYFRLQKKCDFALTEVMKGLKLFKKKSLIGELYDIGESCFTEKKDKDKVADIILKFYNEAHQKVNEL